MFKFLISLVVLIVIVGGLWWSGLLTKWVPSIPLPADFMSQMSGKTATTTPEVPVQDTQAQTPPNDLPTATNDASDAALTQDSASIDAQMQGLAADSTDAQGSLDDKPVSQEY